VVGRLGGCQQSWSIQCAIGSWVTRGLVVGFAEAAADLGGEASLVVGAVGGQPPPVQGADQRGDLHCFRVDGGEQPRRAERGVLGAGWDECRGALAPRDAGVVGVVGVLVPAVAADQEASEYGVEGGGRAEPVQQPQVRALCGDDVGQFVEGRAGLVE
jgi:hypothetical protein